VYIKKTVITFLEIHNRKWKIKTWPPPWRLGKQTE